MNEVATVLQHNHVENLLPLNITAICSMAISPHTYVVMVVIIYMYILVS